ncbi:MAG TPA: aminotransferase class V-fold PLP-dependent enzyme [Thermoanaerobaculia bacterium]
MSPPPFDFSPESLDREFPVRRSVTYFNHAAVAPLPRRVSDAIVAHTQGVRDRGAADWRAWYEAIERTREKAAAFLGAWPSEIAFAPNTSLGLDLVARAFPFLPGDNVVGDDLEFPSNYFPWKLLEERRGVEFRPARGRDGRVTAADIEARIDARTRVVAVSFVAFHNGFVYPLEEIGRLCRDRGILFVVDAIQGLGLVPLSLADDHGPDVVAADGHKWLLSAEGCGLLYVSERVRDLLPPPAAGWWNTISGGNYLDHNLEFHRGARRYEPGTLPTASLAGLGAALDLLTAIGAETALARVLETVGALEAGLASLGWEIATPRPLASGILAAIPPGGDARRLAKRFEQSGVIVAPREGAVRFSPHVGNDLAEVERILQIARELPGGPRP